jgi:prepilin-type N-terminal cleavage/methylation domain-containing protein
MKFLNYKKAFSLIELSIVILIIGILVAGITQSSRLIRQMRLSSARSITQSSPVSTIKDLMVWLESTSEKSFDDAEEENGLTVTNWYDLNPQGSFKYNAKANNVADKPTFVENGINGLPVLSATGSQVMLINDLTDSFSQSGFTWIGVLQWISPASGPKGYFGLKSRTGVGGNSGVTLFLDDCNGQANCFRSISRADGTLNSETIKVTTNYNQYKPHIISIVRSKTSISAFDGGVQLGTTVSDSTVNGIYDGNTPWAVFKYTNDNTLFFQGYAGEYIIYSRPLKDEERKSVEQYLGKKWGIKIS